MKRLKRGKFFTVLSLLVLIGLSLSFGSVTAAESDYNSLITDTPTKPSDAGALQIIDVNGQKTLGDSSGNPIQLRGMSTHGLQWFPEILNDNAFSALSNDWDANVVRLAMYVGEDGYASNQELMKQRVIDGIELAKENDMYVIVDWHVHAPGDPNAEMYSGAMDFFKEISSLYPNDPNIIYELANEPSSNNTDGPGITNDAEGWQSVKSYAEPIIQMLRDNGNDNLVIVGTPNWSQRPDLAADNPIDDNNTAYTAHFYTGTHNDGYVQGNIQYALENGVAVFVTEWGTSEASGNNGPFLDEADAWLDYLNDNNISWVNWSLTNKNETSAAFTPFIMGESDATNLDPGDDQLWSTEELSISGEYVRARIKGISYQPIDRDRYETVVWNFDDGTTQGFRLNGDNPIENVALTNENNALNITGLTASNDLSAENFWANARISADGFGQSIDILGAEVLTMDVIADTPTTVSIAAIPQGPATWWTNPTAAVQVTTDDFVEQSDGTYKAVMTITKEDAPGLEVIGTSAEDSTLANIVLFIGTPSDVNSISLDNITIVGSEVELPVIHDPIGEATFPSNFEGGTRQGWNWSGDSAVNTALTIEEANGSNALSWEFAYPEVKPTDNWASAPRLDFWKDGLTRGDNDYVTFDLYLDPVRASQGSISINLTFQPPSVGYWAQANDTFEIDLSQLDQAIVTDDGLYQYEVTLDLNSLPSGVSDDTELRNMLLIFADQNSDFAGRAYIDNVQFVEDNKAPQVSLNLEDGQYFSVGQDVTVTPVVTDDLDTNPTVTYNEKLDTSTTGAHTYTVTATDAAGNTSTVEVDYYVYAFSGVLEPIKQENVYKKNRTIPVKFRIDGVSNVTATLQLTKDGQAVTTEGNNVFRYDSEENQYIYNLRTKALETGDYVGTVVITFGNTTIERSFHFTLK
ncbi:carbohydrate-binding domain-containing protein [Aquibacillus salsiterrae]|uniref:cellulase n=1 Tax=Aquibacillus salsiterrae TaxID=2950439 RepID=A0A9X4AEL5_9BACI|nr:carbohydrate-binding domain-containing protein [Aquibacillus salsiterrae]MDC3416724.1 cellulase family glycosylhydrolase [Aquibacillus salsiterrae]